VDPKLWFWTGAFVDLTLVLILVAFAIRSIRRGDVERHRRCMITSAALVAGFLGAYVLKLSWLGREEISVWGRADLTILRVHEVFVLLMVLGGGVALVLAHRLRGTRNRTRNPVDPIAPASTLTRHRRAGWTAAVGAAFGWALAGAVLLGMFRRAGLV